MAEHGLLEGATLCYYPTVFIHSITAVGHRNLPRSVSRCYKALTCVTATHYFVALALQLFRVAGLKPNGRVLGEFSFHAFLTFSKMDRCRPRLRRFDPSSTIPSRGSQAVLVMWHNKSPLSPQPFAGKSE